MCKVEHLYLFNPCCLAFWLLSSRLPCARAVACLLSCAGPYMKGCVPYLGSLLLQGLYSEITLKSLSFLSGTAVTHARDVYLLYEMQFYFGSSVFLLRYLPGVLVLLLRGISKCFCPMLHMEYK